MPWSPAPIHCTRSHHFSKSAQPELKLIARSSSDVALELRNYHSALLAVLLLCALRIEASVHEYAGEKFVKKCIRCPRRKRGIYASGPALNESSPGDSFIRLEKIVFRRPLDLSNFSSASVHAILFEVDDRETIGGSAYGGQELYVAQQILQNLESASKAKLFTGHLLIIQVTVEGKTVWKNPTGYLPGRMAPLMRFYGFMSLAFVLLGIFWFSQYARFWREVLPLQNCITLVITLGMFEMALWYFDYAEFNESGVRPTGITVWAVTFGTVKRTILIILIVSMGYVVRPTLGGLYIKGYFTWWTFFVASEVLELIENVGAVSDLSGKARLFFVLPVAILDAFFILWIFTSLSSTLNKLQARRLSAKLDIYRKFTNALAVAVIVSVGWICYELYFKSKDVYNEQWQNAWIIPALWQVLSFSLLCVICALWAPSQNSMRYAYSSEDAAEDFDKDDTLKLIKPSPLASKDVRSPELRSVGSGNGLSHTDLQEEKTA
ncbi:UNVERIFIED_CONTAM: hypothetical protein Slati_0266000 [Sesamum latifolium]|uniref:GOST seven transmembrane domain-containing protein n=1 Tax=Sesamum latifolium TaxID=2727402 RepID=A0AAW2YDR3_9LAMI